METDCLLTPEGTGTMQLTTSPSDPTVSWPPTVDALPSARGCRQQPEPDLGYAGNGRDAAQDYYLRQLLISKVVAERMKARPLISA